MKLQADTTLYSPCSQLSRSPPPPPLTFCCQPFVKLGRRFRRARCFALALFWRLLEWRVANYVYVLRIRNVFGLRSKPKIASRFKLLLIKTCSWTVICFCARAHANPVRRTASPVRHGEWEREWGWWCGSEVFRNHKTKSRQSDVGEDDGVKWAAALKHKMSESESEIKTQQATPTDTSFI